MRKLSSFATLCLLLCCLCSVNARAMENDMLKVGIKYGSAAMFSANLQNYDGAGLGYEMGYFDSGRVFVPLGAMTEETKISVSVDDNLFISGGVYYKDMPANYSEYVGAYHLQLTQRFESYEEAAFAASFYDGGFVAWLGDGYAVRVGQYRTAEGVERAMGEWTGADAAEIISPSRTGVMVTATGTDRILFYFDCDGLRSLAVMPRSVSGENPVTWFKGYRYYGGFEYQRVTGGNISVINVVNIEDYVKGVIGWEIGTNMPLEATKAQAVAARTYAVTRTRHRSQGFDVCSTDDCQVYQGLAASSETTERAVDETAGVYVYYEGQPAETYFYSCNGGASEDAENVWGNEYGYLKGKIDPYEEHVASRIPKYNWSTTFTKGELTGKLQSRGINIGTVESVYISEFTPTGNVLSMTFVGTSGTKTITREACRTTLGLRSMRFTIGGAGNGGQSSYFVGGADTPLTSLNGVYTISGSGTVSQYNTNVGDTYVITSGGVSALQGKTTTSAQASGNTFTFTGSGWGHNIGMSQWGAVAMAELGYDYREILEFYYTDVEVR